MNRVVMLQWCRSAAESRYHLTIVSLHSHPMKQMHGRGFTSLASSLTARQNVQQRSTSTSLQLHQWLLCRFASTSSSSSSSSSSLSPSSSKSIDAAESSQDAIVLYLRDTNWRRNLLPWANVAVMTTLVGVFVWHAFWYIPQYNSMSLQEKERHRSGFMLDTVGTEIDPSGDYAALLYGGIHLYASLIYARRLVSKIVLTKTRELHIWTHRWPSFVPVTKPTTYPLGEVAMNTNRSDMQKIFNKLDGNIHWYRGHLGIFHQKKDGTYPYFLSIKKEHEVKQPEILLHAMVNPGFLTQKNFRHTFKPTSMSSKRR